MQLLEKLKDKISSDTAFTWMKNLCDAISCSTIDTEIYIPQGRYSFNSIAETSKLDFLLKVSSLKIV